MGTASQALRKGLKNGTVAKLVDGMEAQEAGDKAATESAVNATKESANSGTATETPSRTLTDSSETPSRARPTVTMRTEISGLSQGNGELADGVVEEGTEFDESRKSDEPPQASQRRSVS